MADCSYTFKGPDGNYLTVTGIHGLKAYMVDGGLEHLFPERKFPLKAVASLSRKEEPAAKQPTDTYRNQADAETHLREDFGPGIQNLIDKGILNFTQGTQSWPSALQNQLLGGEEAVYYNGKAYIDLQATSKDRLSAVVLHELGEHYNLEVMLGARDYAALQNQITNRAKIKGSEAERTWNQVKALYPDLEVGSKQFISEVIAKLGEQNPKAPWYRRILARIKAFLVERGLGRGFITGTFTEEDMHALLRTSLMSASGRFAKGEPRVYRGALAQAASRIQAARFYSALRRAFARAPEQAFSNSAQLKAWINGNASKYDVKKDEIYWSGLNEWLDMQTGKVSREDVIRFMDENGVKVEDVVLSDSIISDYLLGNGAHIKETEEGFVAYRNNDIYLEYDRGEPKYFDTELEAQEALKDDAKLMLGYDSATLPKHNNAQLTLPGGTDYRELVVTIPTTEKFNEHDSTHFGDVGQGRQISWIRHNTRTDADGNTGLFLEEVQSQRGQEGRKQGFIDRSNQLKKLPDDLKVVKEGRYWNVIDQDGDEYAPNSRSEESAIATALRNINQDNRVPPSPFVTDSNNKATNAYISLLLKKAVSQAIDDGKNFVAWTTGDQQADRYDLSKQLDLLNIYQKPETGLFNVTGIQGESVAFRETDVSESKLNELVGKEIAEKAKNGQQEFKGEGLRIGGGWTQAMYGNEKGLNAQGKPSLILQAANELARKFGGEIGSVELLTGKDWNEQPALIITPQMRDKILNEGMPLFSRPISNLQPAPEERSPLWNRWFGKSKMVRNGQPIKFYHGSQNEFTVFDKNRLATATNHSTAGLGHFFTENPEEAYGYGGNVKEVFLSAQKPYITTSWLLDDKFSDATGAAKFREKLQAEGFDSIYIKDAKYAVVFDSNQAKLTSNASPTFGEDVRFSRAPTAAEEVEIQDSIQDSVKDTAFQLRSKLRKLSDKLFAQAYAFLSVRQMVEQSKEYMTNGHEYEELMQARRATVDSWLIKADRVVSEHWKKLSKSMHDSLANVIHASTLADTDVSKAWTGAEVLKEQPNLMRVYTQSKLSNKNQAWLASLVGGTKDKPAAEVGNGYVIIAKAHWDKVDEILDQLKVLEARQTHTRKINNWPDINAVRKERYAEAKAQYDRLSPQAQFVYTRSNELHNEMFKARLKALEEQINEAVLDLATRKKLNKEFREKMESQGMSHYYAPLARYGDHWFYGTDSEGQNWYSTFESKKERDEAMEEFAKTGTIKGSGTSIKERTGVLGGETADTFIREVNDAIAKNVPGDAGVMLQDQIYKMYIDSLPDVSVRHSAMHRKGVLGFEKDAMRAFSNAMHHGASQLANMIYGRKMQDVLDTAEKALAIASSDNQVQIRKDEITAGDLLIDHWDVLSEPGYIENELKRFKEPSEDEDFVDQEMRDSRFDGVPLDVWVRLREMRNKYGRLDEEQRLEALELNRDRVNQLLEMAKAIKHEDKHKVAAVISELRKTYKAMVTAGSSDMDQVAAYVKQFGFMWTLGFGLSSGLVNMLQTPIVAMPVAYGKYGLSKTVDHFGKSRNEFMKAIQNGLKRDKNGDFLNRDADGNVSISVALEKKLKTLPENSAEFTRLDDELDALTRFKQEGDISRTQTFDIIGIGQEGENHGGKLQDFSKMAGWMFHFGERANREITLMASYRLARDAGMDHDSAIAEARRINNLAHGDYSAENAARIFRGWPSQIALQYKKYVQMQMYLWGSSLLNAIRLIKDRNSVEGREAAKTLGGLFLMQSAFAGTMGLPLMGATAAVINAIGGMFDDEDDPFDAEEEIRLWLTENFGKEAATAIMKGGLNALTPANVGDRLSLRNIFFQEQMIDREGRDAAADYMANMFGPTGGIIRKLFESASMLNKGEGFRAAENALPKFAADTIKAIRYMSEDAQSLNHEKVKDMSEMEIMLQATGFSSSRLEELYSERNMIMKRKKAIDEYRQKLLNDAVQAEEKGDEPDMDAIEAFNDKYPTKAIAKKNILQSEKRREKHRELSEGRGYSIDPKLDFLYDEYDLDESEDD